MYYISIVLTAENFYVLSFYSIDYLGCIRCIKARTELASDILFLFLPSSQPPVPKLLAFGPPDITQWGWLGLEVALLVSSEGRGLRKRRISALNSSIVGGEGGSEIKAWFEWKAAALLVLRVVSLFEDRTGQAAPDGVGTGSQSPGTSPQTTFPSWPFSQFYGSRRGECRPMQVKKSTELAAAWTPPLHMFSENQNISFFSPGATPPPLSSFFSSELGPPPPQAVSSGLLLTPCPLLFTHRWKVVD